MPYEKREWRQFSYSILSLLWDKIMTQKCYRCGCYRRIVSTIKAPTEPAPVCWVHKLMWCTTVVVFFFCRLLHDGCLEEEMSSMLKEEQTARRKRKLEYIKGILERDDEKEREGLK